MPLNKEQALIAEVKKFVEESEGSDSAERAHMSHDLRFVYESDSQWDQKTLDARGDRPHYVFNRVIGSVNNVIGDQRQASPQIKIRPTDGDSDPDTAEVLSGLIRNIEDLSNAQVAYNMAFKHAVAGGYGAWRILPEFRSDRSFDQEIFIKPIFNPFTVFFDPLAQDPCKRDQNACVIAERISRDAHKALFGAKKAKNAASIAVSRDNRGWFTTDQIRIAEYFKKVPIDKEIALMTDGRVIELTDEAKISLEEAKDLDAATIAVDADGNPRIRIAQTFQIKWWKVDGTQILEGPILYDWRFIPVVKLVGRFINIEGRHLTQSLIRHSKDAQRVYNYNRTTMTEVVANAPRALWLATTKMTEGFENDWATANAKNTPFLHYNVDAEAPTGAPIRIQGAEIPVALTTLAAQDADDIKATTGFFDPSLGERGPQESGEAIRARQSEGDSGAFEFMDNLAAALKFTGDILVDMIPKVYDTERTIRILGLDGKEDFVTINAFDGSRRKKIDLGAGRYDVKVSTGPAFVTQRREAARDLLEATGVMPILAEVGPDLMVKALDIADADEFEKRLRKKLILEGVIEPTDEELEEIKPPEPDPVTVALTETEKAKQESLRAKAAKDTQAAQEAQQKMMIDRLQQMEDLIGAKLDNQFKEVEILIAKSGEGQVRVNVDD